MPSFEFVIPDGILFLPANLSFISFCFVISFILYKLIFRSKIVFIVSLVSLLSIAYSDIFIKYSLDKYYKYTKMDSTIYSYPQKDEEGKVDSLATIRVYKHPLNSLTNISSKQEENLINLHEGHISKFIDIPTYTYKYNKLSYNKKRFYLNFYKYDESFIEDKNANARYIVTIKEKESQFPAIYKEFEYRFKDIDSGVVLATAFYVRFENNLNKLRNKFLYWNKEKEEFFVFKDIENFDNIYKKLFIDERDF